MDAIAPRFAGQAMRVERCRFVEFTLDTRAERLRVRVAWKPDFVGVTEWMFDDHSLRHWRTWDSINHWEDYYRDKAPLTIRDAYLLLRSLTRPAAPGGLPRY